MKAPKELYLPPLIIIMILTGVFGLVATDIYAPSLPLVPTLFNTRIELAQLTITVFLVGLAFTQLVAGMLSDSYGRKPVLLLGLVIFLLGTLICAMTTTIKLLLLGRTIQGIGAGAVSVLSRVLLKDLFSGIKMAKIGSYIAAFIGLSPAIAPVIGGFIQTNFGFSAIFIFLLLFAILIFVLALAYLPETNRFQHLHKLSLKNIIKKYQIILSNKIFLANVIATGCTVAVIVTSATINPFLLQNKLNLSLVQYSLWAFVAMFGLFIGMFMNGHWVSKFGPEKMLFAGIVIIFCSGASFIIFAACSLLSLATIIIPTFIIALAAAFILPNAVVGAFAPFPESAGTVGAVYGCLQILITAVVSSLVAALSEPSQLALGSIVVVLMLLSAQCYYGFSKLSMPLA